jgi:dynein light intermediate chain 1, cytosolic
LVSALLQKPIADVVKDDQRSDFALGYEFADVRDDADEGECDCDCERVITVTEAVRTDTLARLSVYTVPSAASSYTALLPHFLPPRTSLPHTLLMIVLDCSRPWTFVEELQTWLIWVEKWVKGDGSRELEIIREECRERCKSKTRLGNCATSFPPFLVLSHLQHFTEPSSEPLPASSTLSSTLLPLGPGTFTHNSSGMPIIVVCTKADLIDESSDLTAGSSGMGGMVKGKGGEWEERTDGVMQVLRTICLKCKY